MPTESSSLAASSPAHTALFNAMLNKVDGLWLAEDRVLAEEREGE
jgi:hypothetical protein